MASRGGRPRVPDLSDRFGNREVGFGTEIGARKTSIYLQAMREGHCVRACWSANPTEALVAVAVGR